MCLIKLKSITKSYSSQSQLVLDNLSFSCSESDWWLISGPSGVGKSTLLNLIGLLDKPSQGEIFIKDSNVNNFIEEDFIKIRTKIFGYVLQEYQLIKHLTVWDNIALPLIYRSDISTSISISVNDILEKIGLSEYSNQIPEQLSGGQRQRVAIARALVTKPCCLLADEPFSALDKVTALKMIDLIELYRCNYNMSVVSVNHDVHLFENTNVKYFNLL